MSWFLNRALTNFRNTVNNAYPNRDKSSDGTIGDLAHQKTSSDHNPDPDGSVDAWDMDVELNGKGKPYAADLNRVIEAALRHESIQYVIYNRRITSRSWGLGTWRAYTGSNPHDKHVHFNTRESHEKSNKPWILEDDLPTADEIAKAVLEAKTKDGRTLGGSLDALLAPTGSNALGRQVTRSDSVPAARPPYANGDYGDPSKPNEGNKEWTVGYTLQTTVEGVRAALAAVAALAAEVAALRADVQVVSQHPPGAVVTDDQLERVLRRVLGSLDDAPGT